MVMFGTKIWFEKLQWLLLLLLNNRNLKIREWFRRILKIIDFDLLVPVYKISPNSIHYLVEKNTVQAVFYSYDIIANALKKEFHNILKYLHNFDIKFANKFAPVLNLGYDTLTSYSSTADGSVTYTLTYTTFNPPTWYSLHNSSTGVEAVTTLTSSTAVSVYYNANANVGETKYRLCRSFFYFDTSSLILTIISDATIKFTMFSENLNTLCVQVGTQSNSLSYLDYSCFTGSSVTNSFTLGNAITINDLNSLDKTGITKYCLRDYTYDYCNQQPPSGTYHSTDLYFSDYNNTSYNPKLVITYTIISTTKGYIY